MPSRSSSSGRGFLIKLSVATCVLATSLAFGSQSAEARTFGGYWLTVNQCCNNEGLYGTRASITSPVSPSDISGMDDKCILARVDAQVNGAWLIQAGMNWCGPQAPSIDLTCGFSYPYMESFVEWSTSPTSGPYYCSALQVIGWNTTHTYRVERTGGTTWRAYVNGVERGGNVPGGGAEHLRADLEYSGGGADAFRAYADWAYSTQWQRKRSDGTWYTIQSANPENCCGWQLWGGPPNHFQVSHGY